MHAVARLQGKVIELVILLLERNFIGMIIIDGC